MSNDGDVDPAVNLTILEALAVATVKPSLCARALERCASSAYGLGRLTAAFPILVSLCYAIVVSEPLWQRMMTLVVLGLVPSAIVLMTGGLIAAILAMGSILVDPASALFRRLMPPLGRAVLTGSACSLAIAGTATLSVAKWIGSLLVAGWHAWEDVVWACYRCVRTAARPWSTEIAHAVVCVTSQSISSLRRAGAATASTMSSGSSEAFNIVVCGLRVAGDKLDFLGCMINAMASMMWMAATFPIRLVARVLLRLSWSRVAGGANGNPSLGARSRSRRRTASRLAD